MNYEIVRIADLNASLKGIFSSYFRVSAFEADDLTDILDGFLTTLKPDLYVGIEYPYVDRVYRNAYNNYYSSKLKEYKRDCIRLSFFSGEILFDDFLSEDGAKKLQSMFLGFLVLRPNYPQLIGRNVLSPDLFKKTEPWFVKVTSMEAAVNGIKLKVEGFPHSSQDSELMVCAETTIWSVMEYFSSTYPDYAPVLPQQIHEILSSTSMQRQVPSGGLTALQISYAFKEFGFGVKSYTPEDYQDDFNWLIRVYVESGIPVVAAIGNDLIGHVMNLVGRTAYTPPAGFKFTEIAKTSQGVPIYDFYEMPAQYLVIDDNLSPYSIISLEDPACNYDGDADWKDCKIFAAIVPLHKRIWMEADRAKALAIEELMQIGDTVGIGPVILKVFLTSSRSFKHYIAINPDLDPVVKTIINSLEMPKFVWIAELATPDTLVRQQITGFILMDATEPKRYAVLASLLESSYIGTISGNYSRYKVPLQPFREFVNLESFQYGT